MRTLLKGLAVAALAVALGPTAERGTIGQGAPARADIRGAITEVNLLDEPAQKGGVLGSVLIEGVREKDTRYDKASVRITKKTTLTKRAGKERVPAKLADLKKGAKVQATFTGPVAESFPVQATAREILILEEPK